MRGNLQGRVMINCGKVMAWPLSPCQARQDQGYSRVPQQGALHESVMSLSGVERIP